MAVVLKRGLFVGLLVAVCAVAAQPLTVPQLSTADFEAAEAIVEGLSSEPVDKGLAQVLQKTQEEAVQAVIRDAAPQAAQKEFAEQAKGLPWRTLVFISTSMPEGALRALFAQAEGREDVVFVLRGWFPPKLSEIAYQLVSLAPNPQTPPNIIIHPDLFRIYGVASVPSFLHMVGPNKWKQVYGEISLPGAEEYLEERRDVTTGLPAIGPTWLVAEPDALAELERRAARIDWNEQMRLARNGLMGPGGAGSLISTSLPEARERRLRMVDPTVQVIQDVRGAQGELLAAAGTLLNPLDRIAFRHTVIVIDPMQEKQVELAKAWIKTAAEGPVVILLARSEIAPAEAHAKGDPLAALAQRIGAPTYPLNDELVERFGLERMPARARAVGNRLEVLEEPVRAK